MNIHIGNLFHLATKKLLQDIELEKRKTNTIIYRNSKEKLEGIISLFGLYWIHIYQDEKGYYIWMPFSFQSIISLAIKIRKKLDNMTKLELIQKMGLQKQYDHQKYLNRR